MHEDIASGGGVHQCNMSYCPPVGGSSRESDIGGIRTLAVRRSRQGNGLAGVGPTAYLTGDGTALEAIIGGE